MSENNGKEKSLFANYIFNFIKTLNSVIFPILTYAYSARIIGVEGVGKINFSRSIVTYFSAIAMLGMYYYGTREAAKVRNDPDKLSQFCLEVLLINGCTTLISYVLLAVTVLLVPHLQRYDILLLICSADILLQGMGMEWLYLALEEYRYVAIRSTVFQFLALALMLIFVRDVSDLVPYAIITIVATSGSYVLNFINARKYIHPRRHTRFEIAKHIRPLLWLFAMTLSAELYTVLDTTQLGFLKDDSSVGLYSTAMKIIRTLTTLITSVGAVMIPRLSFYIGQNDRKKMADLIGRGYNYAFMFSIPTAFGVFMLSNDLILLLSGSSFVLAGPSLRILVPLLVLIPFDMATNQQLLIPTGHEKLMVRATIVGAVVDIVLNSILIPPFAEIGAVVASVIAEAAVAVVTYMNGRSLFDIKSFFRYYYQYWLAAIPIPIISILIHKLSLHMLIQMALTVLLSAATYMLLLLAMKNPYCVEAFAQAKSKLRKKKAE